MKKNIILILITLTLSIVSYLIMEFFSISNKVIEWGEYIKYAIEDFINDNQIEIYEDRN